MAEAKNANLFQANPVKKFPSNHVTQYLAKFQNKTANKFPDNPANPFLVNNVNLYLAKNADLFHLKNAKASQLKCAVEEAALVVMEDQVVDVDIRAEEDTVITVKKKSAAASHCQWQSLKNYIPQHFWIRIQIQLLLVKIILLVYQKSLQIKALTLE